MSLKFLQQLLWKNCYPNYFTNLFYNTFDCQAKQLTIIPKVEVQLVVNIYRAAKRQGKYLLLGTNTEEDNCFSIKLAGE